MALICRDILKLPSLKELKTVAGRRGLGRQLRWVYVADSFDDIRQAADWLYGGELVFITGSGIKKDADILAEFIKRINDKSVAGLVVNVGPYIESIPRAAIEQAEELNFPLFELPWKVKIVEVTHEICSTVILKEQEETALNNLLENLLFSERSLDENLTDRAGYYGYDLTNACRVGILDIDGFAAFLKQRNINDEKMIAGIKNDFSKIVYEAFCRNGKKALTLSRSDSVIFLVQSREEDNEDIKRIIDEIRKEVSARLYGLSLKAGVGKRYIELNDFRRSFKEADQAMRIARSEGGADTTVFYENMGIYTLLVGIKERSILEGYYLEIMRPLLEYDKINNADLLRTLEVYLDENCNITTASERLFIHRNTMKYRIKKIEELTRSDLRDLKTCMKFEVGFKAGKLLENFLKDA